jgi:L-ascorbate metabolism protein UlaG (beta-lactamase superfamily)
MDITYLGLSSFKIKSKDVSLITDPFDPQTVGIKFPKIQSDLVTISHNHSDHNRSDLVQDVKRVISSPGEYEVEGITIRGISVFHDEVKGKQRGKNTIFVIDIEDISVCHLGDLGHELSQSVIEQIGAIHVLMVPVGGFYTIDSKQAAEVVKSLTPNFIIPMHYKMPNYSPKVFGKLEDEKPFISLIGLKVEETNKLTVKLGSFSEEEQVVVRLALT